MNNDKRTTTSFWPTFMWKVVLSAGTGAAIAIGIKVGFRKLARWAREGAPEPSRLYDSLDDTSLFGALGAVLGTSDPRDNHAHKDRLDNNYRAEASFSERLSHKESQHLLDPVTRS